MIFLSISKCKEANFENENHATELRSTVQENCSLPSDPGSSDRLVTGVTILLTGRSDSDKEIGKMNS